ncbi:TrkA C-terminal domain-containing protein [Haloterrigena sp. SYSU A558-1]|uniref:TrkA C-terminal domain-containing protein n=1 Tax=Haloterrigena gelatinilytica TaxID=2741724 RepID=A0A8J8GL94_9EURY|nr:TrkA C-terminal domain-containing protein [Haloterrigena gelatinilytica]NUB90474.1 TrkA C-terminal domain-containing protein [Haloterrigena gelatinilytica]NUC73714.1 TrkA C-terminal domain-containing protein [Haloterrigena gelatinilytica]
MTVAMPLEALPDALLAVELLQSGDAFGGSTTVEWTRTALLGILGYGLLAGVGALAVAFGYRGATVRKLPRGAAVLAGLALPSGRLLLEAIRRGEVVVDSPLVHYTSGSYLLGLVTAGALAATAGHRLGDRLACGVYDVTRLESDGPAADLVRSAGLAVAVALPGSIDDAEGYPAVDDGVKRDLAGRRFLFPNDLSVPELRSRLEARLESDFDIGYVRADLSADGAVEAVAVGDRRPGISPTLGPDRVAVAIAGDPPARASTGDPVEVWTGGADARQYVATGTLRASAGSITTLLVDADDAEAFDPGRRYRLTTRPETPSAGHALVAAIRASDETVTATAVEDGGPLENEFAGWVPGRALAVERGDEIVSLPADKEPLEAGDTLHVFGTPDELAASPSNADDSTVEADADEPPEATPQTAD